MSGGTSCSTDRAQHRLAPSPPPKPTLLLHSSQIPRSPNSAPAGGPNPAGEVDMRLAGGWLPQRTEESLGVLVAVSGRARVVTGLLLMDDCAQTLILCANSFTSKDFSFPNYKSRIDI